jgi:hypothetical protein
MYTNNIYSCRSESGDFEILAGEDLEDAMESYKKHFPEKELESVFLMVWSKDDEDNQDDDDN